MSRNSPFDQLDRAPAVASSPASRRGSSGFTGSRFSWPRSWCFAFHALPPYSISGATSSEAPSSSQACRAIAGHNDRLARLKTSPGDPLAAILPPVAVEPRPKAEADERLNKGKTVLEIVPAAATSWTYRYDPTRPEATLGAELLQHPPGSQRPRRRRPSPRRAGRNRSRDHGTSTA